MAGGAQSLGRALWPAELPPSPREPRLHLEAGGRRRPGLIWDGAGGGGGSQEMVLLKEPAESQAGGDQCLGERGTWI